MYIQFQTPSYKQNAPHEYMKKNTLGIKSISKFPWQIWIFFFPVVATFSHYWIVVELENNLKS